MDDIVAATRGAVAAFVDRHALLPAGAAVVVAVSGGPDSACLLDCLHALAVERGLLLHVAHLDHGLREDGSAAADAAYVRALAARYGLEVTCGQRDVRAVRRESRLSVQAAARLARYDFLEAVAGHVAATSGTEKRDLEGQEAGTVLIATGHTATDQAETVLHHLLRGSGLAGLAGMQPRRGRVIHPLLEVERTTVEAYCSALELAPRQDPSNASLVYTRNRLRHELAPMLQRYNPRAGAALARAATSLAEDLSYLENEAARLLPGLLGRTIDAAEPRAHALTIDQAAWNDTPPALRAHLVRALIARLYGSVEGFDYAHIVRLRHILDGKGGGPERSPREGGEYPAHGEATRQGAARRYAQFPRRLWVERRVGVTRLSIGRPEPRSFSAQLLPVPGAVVLPGGRLTALLTEATPAALAAQGESLVGAAQGGIWVDADTVGGQLVVRPRRPGDALQPLGMGGHHKKVQDVLVDARVPREARDGVPIVVRADPAGSAREEIVWVVGYCLGEPFKVKATTSRVLHLRWEPT